MLPALIAALVIVTGGDQRLLAQRARLPITGETAALFRTWVQAVRQHVPGADDDAVTAVAGLTYAEREQLHSAMEIFVGSLLAEPVRTDNNAAARDIADLADGSGAPGAAGFLKRAAVLHADAAAKVDRTVTPAAPTAAAPQRPPQNRFERTGRLPTAPAVPPLLIQDAIAVSLDGQITGATTALWHWPFARSLLDLVNRENVKRAGDIINGNGGARPATDPFVGAWYHATAAAMFHSGAYGELTSHLRHASTTLPRDPLALFDRGCYAELLGLPILQVLVSAREEVDRRRQLPIWMARMSGPAANIPSREKTNADAERLYREALSIDPGLIEVRVRLARLLDRRGQFESAARELATALDGRPSGAVAFFANLFAGHAAQALGQFDAAAARYQSAIALFPAAQSALLASSQLALLRADADGALSPLARLGADDGDRTTDPWWRYHECSGRDAGELLRGMWASFRP